MWQSCAAGTVKLWETVAAVHVEKSNSCRNGFLIYYNFYKNYTSERSEDLVTEGQGADSKLSILCKQSVKTGILDSVLTEFRIPFYLFSVSVN